MTANQIAYAGLQEETRHNQAAESENARHNQATEAMEQELNRIKAEANRITDEHNVRSDAIQKEYNTTYLELQKAQGDRKLDLQEQLNTITSKRQVADQEYQSQMTGVEMERNKLTARHELEVQRHNKEMESLENQNQFLRYALENKKQEIEETLGRAQVDLGYFRESNVRRKQDFDFLISQEELRQKGFALTYDAQLKSEQSKYYGKLSFWEDWGKPFQLPFGKYAPIGTVPLMK